MRPYFSRENCVTAKPTRLVYVALTTAVGIWGAGFAVGKYALHEISPLHVLAGSGVFAAATQVIWTVARGGLGRLRLPRRRALAVVALSFSGQNLSYGLTYLGLAYTTATNAAILYAFTPTLMAVLGTLFLRERLNSGKLLGAVGGFLGVALIITQGRLSSLRFEGMLIGNLIIFGAVTYWSSYSVLTRWVTRNIPADAYSFYVLALGSTAPIAWVWVAHHRFPLSGLQSGTLWALAFLGAGAGTLAMNCWNWGLSKVEAARAGMFSYLEPVFASAVAFLFLGERFTLPSFGGALLVLASIFAATQIGEAPSHVQE